MELQTSTDSYQGIIEMSLFGAIISFDMCSSTKITNLQCVYLELFLHHVNDSSI